MRGNANGALNRSYLHSGITEALWYAVVETESLFAANLSHAVMLASMYAHPTANLEKGNDQIHDMYLNALNTFPYIKSIKSRSKGETDALIDEWKRVNAEEAVAKANKSEEA